MFVRIVETNLHKTFSWPQEQVLALNHLEYRVRCYLKQGRNEAANRLKQRIERKKKELREVHHGR